LDLKVGCWVAHLICDIIQAAGDSDAMICYSALFNCYKYCWRHQASVSCW